MPNPTLLLAPLNGAGQITTAAITPALEGYGPLNNLLGTAAATVVFAANGTVVGSQS